MTQRKPDWLKVKITGDQNTMHVNSMLRSLSLNTICTEANCPNKMECYKRKTAAFMILGTRCTRGCTFCNVTKGSPQIPDPLEPENLSSAVKELELDHVVITSVTRDDLPDGGAEQFCNVIKSIRENTPDVTIEVLIPDLNGNMEALNQIVLARPDILNHNVETVASLYPRIRPEADLNRSISLLQTVKRLDPSIATKSGLMVGLGESFDEVLHLLDLLYEAHCNIVTIGQYLAPSSHHTPVIEYIHPDVFEQYRLYGVKLGFDFIASGPLVRSSYHAEEALSHLVKLHK